jgi:hypothetical protein
MIALIRGVGLGPVESDIRPTAVSLAASLKQEPSAESHGRFW